MVCHCLSAVRGWGPHVNIDVPSSRTQEGPRHCAYRACMLSLRAGIPWQAIPYACKPAMTSACAGLQAVPASSPNRKTPLHARQASAHARGHPRAPCAHARGHPRAPCAHARGHPRARVHTPEGTRAPVCTRQRAPACPVCTRQRAPARPVCTRHTPGCSSWAPRHTCRIEAPS